MEEDWGSSTFSYNGEKDEDENWDDGDVPVFLERCHDEDESNDFTFLPGHGSHRIEVLLERITAKSRSQLIMMDAVDIMKIVLELAMAVMI
ncbi:unnamed protein product [Parascedosporium putredinis]|uniref:Uncharacterized protein n=1 Tax=Parascedosporium putredinis TaxID=1442378 RepID=A0A9P1M8U7_9PEZI|nr:unnamed protein product [Parascedosporium putredinis]CAI7993445.1 unnamed protein product [Parascedosporium putredinis]